MRNPAPYCVFLLTLLPLPGSAQSSATRKTFEGNQAFGAGKFAEAIAAYQAALQAKDTSLALPFNLGTALLKDKKPAEARAPLTAAAAKAAKGGDMRTESAAHYNLGSSYLAEKKWQDAVTSCKAALKKNPADKDAKYNLSYALKHLAADKDKKDKKEEEKKKEDPKKPEEEKKKEEPKEGSGNKSKLNPEQAEQILDAVADEEKALQKKMRKGKGAGLGVQKDW